ncbi:hypothetical protein CC78DRAFT_530408 [Lojkania enalia]|uniref:Uncharacterized protein n=1 Tax=Lojkania enalia TaxID=147567 RepID=A0A9P4KG33_9PLEO|nr:hypothetical protein CC78DRAFT_530408 [Didymosphaeria enalia]
MERTPSPRRVHTPPAPLHGTKYDSYEPYSPRRSSRVAAQRGSTSQQRSPNSSRPLRASTPTSSKRKSAARASNQALSPPSSPVSPYKHGSHRLTRPAHLDADPVDSDSDHVAPTPAKRYLLAMEGRGMLPTPAKTPRKRPLQSEEELRPTARVLFPSRPATVEDAMPTPRKHRKSRRDVYALESFAEQIDEGAGKIPIYTDSKERVPEVDNTEENVFLSRKGKGKAKANGKSEPHKVDSKTAKMEEAVNRGEGMIYTFRGKKIFRKFEDGPVSHDEHQAPEFSGDEQLRRRTGAAAHRPLTRSSIKPRKLFQEEIAQLHREQGIDDADEEAVTDIEVPIATPSHKRHKEADVAVPAQQEATPPPTVRTKRQISFEGWQRVKTRKRSGSALESGTEKRTRSEPSSSMSVDNI